MADPDTLWYHMPFAARFAHDGWTTHLQYTQSEPITTFHPAGAELVHGIGILLFGGYDLLSPFVNLGFAGLALLGGWVIGRRFGVAPAALIGIAVVLSVPIVLQTQPGEAANDAIGLAWLVAAAALLLRGGLGRAPLAFAAAAAGMALGTKLSLLAPVGLLTMGLLMAAPRGARKRSFATWTAVLLGTGGFWYLRNLLQVGNPLPWYRLHAGFLDLPSPPLPQTNANSFSLAHYIGDLHLWRTAFVPGLDTNLGHLWPAVVGLSAVGALAFVATRADPLHRAIGATAFAGLLAYVITPATAGGPRGLPILFGLNLRFVTPPLALGLALLPCAKPLADRRRRGLVVAAMLALLVATQWSASFRPPAAGGWGFLVAALIGAGAVTVPRRSRWPAAAALIAVVVVAGFPVARQYLRDRYARLGPTLPRASIWARHLEHERIGIVGYLLQYPLYGPNTSNRVVWLGHRGAHGAFSPIRNCRAWRAAIDAGRYRYVVTAPMSSVVLANPHAVLPEPREAGWTRSGPGAHQILRDAATRTTVFRIDTTLGTAGCPGPATVSRRG